MEIEFKNTKSDYLEFYKFQIKEKLQKNIIVLIILPLIIGYASGGSHFEWLKFLLGVVISELLLLCLFYLIPYFIFIIKLNKATRNKNTYTKIKRIITQENGLSIETNGNNMICKWESILSSNITAEFVYLTLADKSILIIPKRFFLSENDALNFLGVIRNGILKVRGFLETPLAVKSHKPPYALGLIGLVPFIGAIVGLGLILYGIFKYKDKWLVLSGLAGPLVTTGFIWFLHYQSNYLAENNNGLIQITQMQLNSVMKEVEFYKIQYGKYPDSLEQLYGEDLNMITDPIQSSSITDRKSIFNYQKSGDKYYLFSSGIDRIPHTEDDLYPTIAQSDSSQSGIIREKLK